MEAAHSSKSLQRTDYPTPYIKPKDHTLYYLWSYWYESNGRCVLFGVLTFPSLLIVHIKDILFYDYFHCEEEWIEGSSLGTSSPSSWLKIVSLCLLGCLHNKVSLLVIYVIGMYVMAFHSSCECNLSFVSTRWCIH